MLLSSFLLFNLKQNGCFVLFVRERERKTEEERARARERTNKTK